MGEESKAPEAMVYNPDQALFVLLVLGIAIVIVAGCAPGMQLMSDLGSQSTHTTNMAAAADAATALGMPTGLNLDRVHEAVSAVKSTAAVPGAFPIDAMYTWVKGTDPAWWDAKARAYEQHYKAPFKENPRDPLRHPDDHDELYYSVHMTAKFCPWLSRIWILSAPGHRPAWMPPSGPMMLGSVAVVVVHHDRVFDPKCVTQPTTFNSYVIEAQIPHIARLAEHFLMFNDDFFIGRPMHRTDFFTDQGLPKVHIRDVSKSLSAMNTMWAQHLRNMQARVRALTGKAGLVPDHVVAPVRKSVLKAVVKTLEGEVCVMKPFRTSTDFPSWYVALNIAPSVPRGSGVTSNYFPTGPSFVQFMKTHKHPPALFCINQEFTDDTRVALQRILDK
jgi:hypothetical protein